MNESNLDFYYIEDCNEEENEITIVNYIFNKKEKLKLDYKNFQNIYRIYLDTLDTSLFISVIYDAAKGEIKYA